MLELEHSQAKRLQVRVREDVSKRGIKAPILVHQEPKLNQERLENPRLSHHIS
jgi:hypothetical protein